MGNLEGPPELVKKANAIALELVGQEFAKTGRPAAGSLTHSLRLEEELYEQRYEQYAATEFALTSSAPNTAS